MLGLHPEIQQQLRKEIDEVFEYNVNDNDLTVEQLKQLKYLDCVIKEVQRIYPTAPFVGRDLTEDTKISKL